MKHSAILTRTIWTLSLVSLFTDISSEMLYPVMPLYLKSIGFTALWIGVLEGLAEAVVGLSKGYFGKRSDEIGKRLPFVQWGYFLSAFSKPLMVLSTFPLWIFTARSTDRLGKGIRTGARDALLSDEAGHEHKGKVFGFHRGMDTLGAAIGPVLALVFLYFYPEHYKQLFLIAFLPAIVGVSFTFLIKEKNHSSDLSKRSDGLKKSNFFSYFSYWKKSSSDYKRVVVGLLAFALFNSSDIFLLLMAKHAGITDQYIIIVYIFYNLVYALASYPIGIMADKIGMKKSFVSGLILFSVVYLGMACLPLFNHQIQLIFVLFFLYGLYAASTEGISKAWISKLCLKNETATAIGFFASGSSIITLLASSIAGLLWVTFTPSITFLVSAISVLLIAIYFFLIPKNTPA